MPLSPGSRDDTHCLSAAQGRECDLDDSLTSTRSAEEAPAEAEPGPGPAPIPALSISEAARACAVSRRTIRHHRQNGDFPGAFKDENGVWRIPPADLEAVGLQPTLSYRLEEPPEAAHIERLRTEVAILRERLRAAEMIAMEREKRIEDLRLILRYLPGPEGSKAHPISRVGPAAPLDLGRGMERPSLPAEGAPGTRPPEPARESDLMIWLPDAPPGDRSRPGAEETAVRSDGVPVPVTGSAPSSWSARTRKARSFLPWRRPRRP